MTMEIDLEGLPTLSGLPEGSEADFASALESDANYFAAWLREVWSLSLPLPDVAAHARSVVTCVNGLLLDCGAAELPARLESVTRTSSLDATALRMPALPGTPILRRGGVSLSGTPLREVVAPLRLIVAELARRDALDEATAETFARAFLMRAAEGLIPMLTADWAIQPLAGGAAELRLRNEEA